MAIGRPPIGSGERRARRLDRKTDPG